MFCFGQESERAYRVLLKRADCICADLIWLGYGNISYPLLRYIKEHSDYKVVLDTDSVWSRFILRGLPFAQDDQERRRIEGEGKEKEVEERWGTELADVTTAVSEVDAEYYRTLARHPHQVHLFSNAIDPESYLKVPPPPDNFRRPCLYLAGTFGPRSPMDDAARWAIREILPMVRLQVPDIHFYIVGSGSDHTLSNIRDSGITTTGRLPSTLPHLCYADVAIVPLRFESGTRFKILEAAACGIPIVSTTLGAEGIPVTHEENILIADEPRSFADSIVRLIRDRHFALGLAKNLKTLVYERYSVKSLTQEGQRILEYVLQKKAKY
jgi:glycosyltransferase involved in cell wall biosynthesis